MQKQSKTEADQAIADYKAQKEAEYKQATSSVDTSDYAKSLNDNVDKEIAKMRQDSKKNVEEVSKVLLQYVVDVDVSIHKNTVKS